MNVGAADADIGEFAVAETAELAEAAIVALPFVDEADEGGKHGSVFLWLEPALNWPANLITRKIAISGRMRRNYVAVQLGEKRMH